MTVSESAHPVSAIRRIVAGVDGSAESLAALEWAVDLARLTGAEVRAVQAWQTPPVYVKYQLLEAREAAEQALGDTVKLIADGVNATAVLVDGPAAHVLIDAGRDADLLVVGSRGYGGFTGLLMGSVSAQCVQHASCPVTVIPRRADRATPENQTEAAAEQE